MTPFYLFIVGLLVVLAAPLLIAHLPTTDEWATRHGTRRKKTA